jgi:NhaP-type Na+/H+ and K+/H+ antiporter
MILGLVSMILGVVVLIAIWPYSFDSFNAIASYLVILLLIIFGGRIFFIDFKKYLMVRNKKNQYFAQLEDQLASKQTPNYPPYDLLSQPSVLSKVVKLIKLRQVKNAQPILNNEVAFKAAQLKFMFFSWLFKENDDYRTYKNWKKIYKRIHQATSDVISDVFSDLEQGSYLVDIANTKADGLSPGSYVLKQE